MESKTASERVLMPFQETRELLYRLMRGGFIAIQVGHNQPPTSRFPLVLYSTTVWDCLRGFFACKVMKLQDTLEGPGSGSHHLPSSPFTLLHARRSKLHIAYFSHTRHIRLIQEPC